MKKQLILLLVLITSTLINAQNERKTLFGIIYDDNGPLENAHIVNFTTHQATFSNDKGEYRIIAKANDSIRFTSIAYESIFEILTEKDFNTYRKRTTLKRKNYTLDVVNVKNNELSGSLNKDINKVKKNASEKNVQKATDFSQVKPHFKIDDDHIDKNVKPVIANTVPNTYEGVGITAGIGTGKARKLKKLRKQLAYKEGFPSKLLDELGEEFFFTELKIPVEKYYHFLEYANPLGIEKLYQDREVLKVINILRKEHSKYLSIIKQ